MGCSFANTEWHSRCIYDLQQNSYKECTYIYIYIYINTELLDGNQGHQEETQRPTHRFRRLFLDLLSMGWRGSASAMGAIKLPPSCSSNDKTTNDQSIIANAFNNFFVNIGPTLASKIPAMGDQYKSYMPAKNDLSMFVTPVSEPEIKKLIMQLNDGAPGRDGVTAMSLKCITDHIAMPLSRLANLSFTQGIFPRDLKIAMVSPLYKAKDPMIFSNYRPISLLSSFSKIFEKLMSNRLLNFLNKCDILNKYQFGFRNNHSTYMALVILLENVHNALDKGECAIGIFLDFQKAFDTVNHGILLDKLYHYGIGGPAYDWFSSYLNERYQFVVYNGCESEHKYIQCGVPQGSILGPLPFLICINDLPSISNLFMPILFADDTNLFCTGRNIDFLVNEIKDEMSKVKCIPGWKPISFLWILIKQTSCYLPQSVFLGQWVTFWSMVIQF